MESKRGRWQRVGYLVWGVIVLRSVSGERTNRILI